MRSDVPRTGRVFLDRASVAEFYGFDASELPEKTVQLYLLSIPKLEARRELRTRRAAGELTEEYAYRLMMAAEGDERLASKYQALVTSSRQRMEQ